MNNYEVITNIIGRRVGDLKFESFLNNKLSVDIRRLSEFEYNPYFDDRNAILDMIRFLKIIKEIELVDNFYVIEKVEDKYIENIILKLNNVQTAIYNVKDSTDFRPNSAYILHISVGESMFLCRVLDYCISNYHKIIYELYKKHTWDIHSFNVDFLNSLSQRLKLGLGTALSELL